MSEGWRGTAALDVGTVRIGVAAVTGDLGVAVPVGTVRAGAGDAEEVASMLAGMGVSRVVVGWPLELDGSEGPAVRRTRAFAARLKAAAPGLRILRQDERLTSVAAEDALMDMGVTGSRRRGYVDGMAAALILQRHIDRHGGRRE